MARSSRDFPAPAVQMPQPELAVSIEMPQLAPQPQEDSKRAIVGADPLVPPALPKLPQSEDSKRANVVVGPLVAPTLPPRYVRRIQDELYPAIVEEASQTMRGRWRWKRAADVGEASAKLISGVAAILAFAAGVYDQPSLSFAAGCTGTVGMVVSGLGAYALRESQERTRQLNAILDTVGISIDVPDVVVDESGD